MKRLIATALLVTGVAVTPPAQAAPACSSTPPPLQQVARIPGELEAIAVDQRGRMFLTDLLNQYLWRIDRPGATPVVVAKGFSSLGGLVVQPDGSLLVGSGNDPVTGLTGYLTPTAKIWKVDPDTGAKSVFAMVRSADGLAQAPDGTVYASNLFGDSIARIRPGGAVDLDWAHLPTGNGLVVDATGQTLYAVSSVVGKPVWQIPTVNPAAKTPYAATTTVDELNIPDGLTRDSRGDLIVATHLGQLWKVAPGGATCALADHLYVSSNVGYGNGDQGFSRGRLYRIGFDGRVLEVPAGFDPS